MVYEGEPESGGVVEVHAEFECTWGGGDLESVSSVVTQLYYHGSKACDV